MCTCSMGIYKQCVQDGMCGWKDVHGRRDVMGMGGWASCREGHPVVVMEVILQL